MKAVEFAVFQNVVGVTPLLHSQPSRTLPWGDSKSVVDGVNACTVPESAMSPLQYQKQLRLVAARERMLVEGIDAASAAFEVGYESASQFNREYKRFFGQPPMRDIKVRRLVGSVMVSD
jgi:AraC-like DNA-binding protein